MDKKVIMSDYGYYYFEDTPDQETLQKHYSEKYYQTAGEQSANKTYNAAYDIEEHKHKQFVSSLIVGKALKLLPNAQQAYDLGCGEGFLMAAFMERGLAAYGMDFSGYAINNFNPQCVPYFTQGDVGSIEKHKDILSSSDIVTCINVLEHVISPTSVLKQLHNCLSKDALLVIKVPNDYSDLHKYLLEKGHIKKEFWLSYPEHLSYFNKDSLTNLLDSMGFGLVGLMADYPIDLMLLNDQINYVDDSSKGKLAHQQRVRTELFLSKCPMDKVISLYEAYAELGIGRNLVFFVHKKK